MSLKGFFNKRIVYHDVNMWVAGAAYGIAVYLILVILEPFGISVQGDARYINMIPFGIVTFLGCVAPYYILPLIKKDFFYVENWTRGKNAIQLLTIMTIVSVGNLTVFVAIFDIPVSLELIWVAIWQTLVIGCLIFGIIVFLPEKKRRIETEKEAEKENEEENKEEIIKEVVLRGAGKEEEMTIQIEKLLYIESERNYCNIVTTDGEVQIRSTMASIEDTLAEYKEIKKCHRAYMINTKNIVTMDGNSTSGYRMIMKGGLLSVPIARQYVKEMMAL